MFKFRFSILVLIVVGILVLTACSLSEAGVNIPTLDPNLIQTIAAKTVQVALSQTPAATIAIPASATPEVVQPTLRPTSTSSIPTMTNTPVKTSTPIPSSTSVAPCNAAAFIKDVNFPDGTDVVAGTAFTKTWRLQNVGTCTWTTDYQLVFSKGDQMGGPASTKLASSVAPGQSVDLSVALVAPKDVKSYQGFWVLKSPTGISFGISGNKEGGAFWVKIDVITSGTSTGTFNFNNFATAFCAIEWTTPAGAVSCPSASYDFTNGSVIVDTAPTMEGGYKDDEPAIVVVPKDGNSGNITGKVPSFKVKDGDQFKAIVGCMDGMTKCTLTFRLDISVEGGAVTNLKTLTHTYGAGLEKFYVDLTPYKDKNVVLYMVVTNNDNSSKDDKAFWLRPGIFPKP